MSDQGRKIVPLGPAAESMGRAIGRSSGRRRMDILLSRPNAAALVRALPVEDLYFLIKEVGLDDAGVLVAMSTPEHFRGFLDLEAWTPSPEGHLLASERVLEWLEVAREADPACYREKLSALDLEVLELLIRDGLHVVSRREEEEAPVPPPRPGPETLAWESTPCGEFFIAYKHPESPEGKALRRLLDEIYAMDAFGASRLLSALRVELDAELTETALRFRTARLEDLGFPPLERALELYARRDPGEPLPPQPEPPEAIPGFQLAQVPDGSFLQRAAAHIGGTRERTHLDRALLYLTNMALVADRVEPSDLEAVREVTSRVHATLSLGLAHRSGEDEVRGAELLAHRSLKTLFQVGFTLTLDLRAKLERALAKAGLDPARAAPLFDEPERSGILALLAPRPQLALALGAAEGRGWPELPGAYLEEGEAPLADLPEGRRAFASHDDLRLGEALVGEVAAGARLLGAGGPLHLPAPEGDEAPPPSLATRVATLLLLRALRQEAPLSPLSPAAARDGLDRLFEPGGRPRPEPFRALAGALGAAAPGSEALVVRALSRLLFEVRPVLEAGEPVDPRFVSLLWLEA